MFAKGVMVRFGVAGVLFLAAAARAAPVSDERAMLAPLVGFRDAFNAAAPTLPDGLFSRDAVIVDAFAPFVWTAPDAPAHWYADITGHTEADRAKFRAQHQHVTFGAPEFLRAERGRGYYVVPATYTWNDGAPHRVDARWGITVVHEGGAWRMSSQSWLVSQER